MYKDLIKKINEYDSIVIFRHARPDGDAVFSQFAMYQFLIDNFPNKNIQMYGKDTYDVLPYKNILPIEHLRNSLAIVLDTANRERADDNNFLNCDYVIKIDHHPITDNYANLSYIDDKAAATSEILTKIFLSKDFKKYKLSIKTCEYLYCGIISDSINFKTASTTHETLKYASLIVEYANLDLSALSNFVFNHDIKYFDISTKIRSMLKIKKGVGYIIANKKDLDELKISSDEIKNRIDEFNSITGLNIWSIFAYNNKTKLYDASLRSKNKYVVNKIAAEYNGGGHKNAAGIKNVKLKDVKTIINKLVEVSSI